ncbi:sugar kinase [Kitasatospora sp. NPDC096147]|uniref:sugar kinase n=1 Tax=Kitasatospora sp. NPDC096147 TaxID=3364093 RepID=UPI0037F8736B
MTTAHAHPALVTLGDVLASLTSAVPGPLVRGGGLAVRVAGAEANTAIGVSRLGVPAAWQGVLSSDELGDLITRELRAEGVTVHARRAPEPTGLLIRTLRTAERSTVAYYRAGTAGTTLLPEDLDLDAVRRAGLLHVSGITPALGPGPAEAVRTAVRAAVAAGVPVSTALNHRQRLWSEGRARPELTWLVRHSAVVFASAAEARLVLGKDLPADAAAAALAGLGPEEVLVSDGGGALGVYAGGLARLHHPTARTVVDTVGAGDSLAAGYLAARLRGLPLAERIRIALATARHAVTTVGDWDGLPTWDEVAAQDDRQTDDITR